MPSEIETYRDFAAFIRRWMDELDSDDQKALRAMHNMLDALDMDVDELREHLARMRDALQ